MRPLVPLIALLAALLAASCSTTPPSPLRPLEEADEASQEGDAPARQLALAGFHAWFVRGDAVALQQRVDAALALDAAEPWALFGRAELARRGLDDRTELQSFLSLCEAAPGHALCLVGAERCAQLAGRGAATDSLLSAKLPVLLERAELPVETRARLARAFAAVLRADGLDEGPARQLRGLPAEVRVAGPLSPFHALSIDLESAPERAAPVAAAYAGPFGELPLRTIATPSGAISIGGEWQGDLFVALVRVDVESSGAYALRLRTPEGTSAKVLVDGLEIVERVVADGARRPRLVAQALELDAGRHLLAVKIVRFRGRAGVEAALLPLEGQQPPKLSAAVVGDEPGRRPQPLQAGDYEAGRWLAGPPRELAAALAEEAGVVGAYAAAIAAGRHDREGALALLTDALAAAPDAAALLTLRAELVGGDPKLPDAIAQARAAAALDHALTKDPLHARALTRRAAILRRAGRHEAALEPLLVAEGAHKGRAALARARARVELARSHDGLALAAVREALAREPGRCSSLELLFDLAQRIDAVAEIEQAAREGARCAGGRSRLVRHLVERGALGEAELLSARLAKLPLGRPEAALLRAEVQLARGEAAAAARTVEALEGRFPLAAALPRRTAELYDRAGDVAAARAARERVLRLDGADLATRRALLPPGKDVLQDLAVDGLALAKAHLAANRSYDARAAVVLDFGAVEAYPDGTAIERIHTITQLFDKRSLDEAGEVKLPPGAEPIRVRTIKRDGRVLEPETIAEKDQASLPGLEPGDLVEVEYLQPIPSRGPILPGWTGSAFFFRSNDVPLVESVYHARALPGAGLEVEVQNGLPRPTIEEKDGVRTTTVRVRDVPALVGEPRSPGRGEYVPWAQVGAGAAEAAVALAYADGVADDADGSAELREWAEAVAAKAAAGDDAAKARAIYDEVMAQIPGRESSFGRPASHVLAEKRGNRLLLVAAGLSALRVPWRFAAVRGFTEDPAPHRFPDWSRWGALVLHVEPRGGEALWLDPSQRWAPFGALQPRLRGQPAWLLPRPGEAAVVADATTPASDPDADRHASTITGVLARDGALTAQGTERYEGHSGAGLRAALEELDETTRRQRIEAALSRALKGVTLQSLTITLDGPPGTPLVVTWSATVPAFARPLGDGRMALDLGLFPVSLARRFVTRGARESPLLLADPERTEVKIALALPAGAKVLSGAESVTLTAPQGRFTRTAGVGGDRVEFVDRLALERGRLQPAGYAEFAAFATSVDAVQRAELVLAVP